MRRHHCPTDNTLSISTERLKPRCGHELTVACTHSSLHRGEMIQLCFFFNAEYEQNSPQWRAGGGWGAALSSLTEGQRLPSGCALFSWVSWVHILKLSSCHVKEGEWMPRVCVGRFKWEGVYRHGEWCVILSFGLGNGQTNNTKTIHLYLSVSGQHVVINQKNYWRRVNISFSWHSN